jgi:hypothetical protein
MRPKRTGLREPELNRDNIENMTRLRCGKELTTHAIGSYELGKYPQSAYGRGPPTKLLPFCIGPSRVETVNGDRYKLRKIVNGKIKKYHIQLLKPFFTTRDLLIMSK